MKPPRLTLIFIAGGLFGAGLAISGMTDPARVIGFLDVFGKWDPALLFVMGGAVIVYGVGMFGLRTASGARMFRGTLKLPQAQCPIIDRRLIIGAAIFGVGWGLGGFCPGPSLANLGALRVEALVFVPAMAGGMILAQQIFHVDSSKKDPQTVPVRHEGNPS